MQTYASPPTTYSDVRPVADRQLAAVGEIDDRLEIIRPGRIRRLLSPLAIIPMIALGPFLLIATLFAGDEE
jgi:hypothetical protein